jgi:hypothetical protein
MTWVLARAFVDLTCTLLKYYLSTQRFRVQGYIKDGVPHADRPSVASSTSHHFPPRQLHFSRTAALGTLTSKTNLPMKANNDNGYLSYNIIVIITPVNVKLI